MFRRKEKPVAEEFDNPVFSTPAVPANPGLTVMGDDVEITVKSPDVRTVPEHPVAAIPETCVIKGELNCSSDIHINGLIEGVIRSEKSVHILKNGRIEGDIFADSIEIDGSLEGNCIGREVSINATGTVNGQIQSDSLSINKKGRFFGTSQPRTDGPHELNLIK